MLITAVIFDICMQQEVNDFYTAAQDIQNEVVPTKEERELLDSLTEKEKTMDIDMEAIEEAVREKEMEERGYDQNAQSVVNAPPHIVCGFF